MSGLTLPRSHRARTAVEFFAEDGDLPPQVADVDAADSA